jgi:hypothetical protein
MFAEALSGSHSNSTARVYGSLALHSQAAERLGVERPALARSDERAAFTPGRSNGLLCGWSL